MKILLVAIIVSAILAITIPIIMPGDIFANGVSNGDGGLHCVGGNGGDIYNLHGGCVGTYEPM
jgi:hypothetical protein